MDESLAGHSAVVCCFGAVSGLLLQGWRAVIVGGGFAGLGVAAWVLYEEFLVPRVIDYSKGPSMWPIALVVAGTVAAAVGAAVASAVGRLRAKRPRS
jgi:hypothetical protein